jgi:eukaryotic-like serine/threonine-protein kinase
MFRNLIQISVILLAFFLLLSCGKKYSTDDVLPNSYSPSIIVGAESKVLTAINPANGETNWQLTFANSLFACPLVYGGYVYIGTANLLSGSGLCDTLYKINSKTGKFAKKISFPGSGPFNIRATPLADGQFIYIAGMNDSLYSIDTGTTVIKWRFGADGPIESSPTIYSNNVYFATLSGSVYCVNKTDGTLVWQYSAGAASPFVSSGAVSFPNFYIGSRDSNMYCFDITPGSLAGRVRWRFKAQGGIEGSPAAGAGKVIFGCQDFNVYCLDTVTGLPTWTRRTMSNVLSSPVISTNNKYTYIGSNDGNVYALNITDGSIKWTYNTTGFVTSSPTYYAGNVYIGSASKYFWAINGETGTLLWRANLNGAIERSAAVENYSGRQYNSQVSGMTNWY